MTIELLKRRVIVDTREPPDSAWFSDLPHVRAKLDCGDFSIEGLEHLVGVERTGAGSDRRPARPGSPLPGPFAQPGR